jgi:uncharacterized RDD family membrane protein YckC
LCGDVKGDNTMTSSPPGVAPALPKRGYTSWLARCTACVIDLAPVVVGWAIWKAAALGGAVLECVTYESGGVACTNVRSGASGVALGFLTLLSAGYLLWNFGHRQGATGSSLGKALMRFRVVDEKTWQPLGFAPSLLRQAVHVVDAVVCFLGFLLPLWDARRQTLADKLTGTVCVPRAPRQR